MQKNKKLTHDVCWLFQRFIVDVIGNEACTRPPIVDEFRELDKCRRSNCCADKLLHSAFILDGEDERLSRWIQLLVLSTKIFSENEQKFLLGRERVIRLRIMLEFTLSGACGGIFENYVTKFIFREFLKKV